MLQGVSIQYGVLRTMPIYIMADSQAGIRLAEYDWYTMSSSLKTRAGYIAIEDVNLSRYLDSSKVVRRLVDILLHPLRHANFHIFWSLTPENTGFGTNPGNQLLSLECIVSTLANEGHMPYICIDPAKLEDLQPEDDQAQKSMFDSLERMGARGALVDTTTTFWMEREQLPKFWVQ